MKVSANAFILIVAVASGAASLVCQVVCMCRLALVFGSTTLLTMVLIAFGGLASGNWIGARLAARRPQFSFVTLGAVEFATGFSTFAILWSFDRIEALYAGMSSRFADRAVLFGGLQLILSAVVLLPPAILMGLVLPLLARRMMSTKKIVGAAGAVYGWNALGAAAGAAGITYGLLPGAGLASALASAGAINLVTGVAAFSAEIHMRKHPAPANRADSTTSAVTGDSSNHSIEFLILIGLAASGFGLTTFETAGVRLIAMVMGSFVYVYGASVVLALIGVALGSALCGRVPRGTDEHQRWVAVLGLLIVFTAALSMLVLPRIPFLFTQFFSLLRESFRWQIAAHFASTAMVAFLPPLLFGAMFPAAIGSFGGGAARFGETVGAACVANGIGMAAGFWVAGFVLIPTVGLYDTMNAGVLAAVGAGLAVWWRIRARKPPRLLALAPAAAVLVIVILAWILVAWPRQLFAGIGFVAPRLGTERVEEVVKGMRLLYYHDGRSATISVNELGQTRFLRSNGETKGSTDPIDMTNELLLGQLPMLLHAAPREVLTLGLGTGLKEAAVARYPVQRIDIVEGDSAAAPAARFFEAYTRKVLDDPRVHLIIAPVRSWLLTGQKQYDVVISDLPDVWGADASSLATIEFYRIVGARLRAGGIFVQCVHAQRLLPEDVVVLTATFHAVFPHTEIWTSAPGNLILLGTRDPIQWDYSRLEHQFEQTHGVADDLKSIGIWQAFALFGAQILGENESDWFTRNIEEISTDDRPVLEFRIPRSLYTETTSEIRKELNPFRRPDAPPISGFNPQRDLNADSAYLLGFAYASMGQTDLAIRYMERSTAMAPDRSMFLVGLGNQYRTAGRTSEARAAYERALSLDLNNVEALVSLGEIRLDEGQPEWTRVLSERALRLAPLDARVHALIDRLQQMER